jgi:LPS-assembly lipoprotein
VIRRPALIAAAALGLSACGFTPLYGEGAGMALSRVAVSTPDDRFGYRLREALEDAFGADLGATPAWRLETAVEQDRRPVGRRIDDTAARYELTVRMAWVLTPTAGGRPVTGLETAVVTYASADQPVAAIAAQEDAEVRAAAELAREVRLDVLAAIAGR